MKKRFFINLLAALMLIAALTPAAFALDGRHIADGTCGEGLSWSLDGYTLTVTGSGEMEDGAPWAEYKDHIEHVVLTGGITKVGKEAFYKYDRIETVDFGDALTEIGDRAFYGCEDIDFIHLPSTFKKFGAESFRGCLNLKYVYCDGGMPRFGSSCLWSGGYISVFYPTNNPWPADSVNQLVHNFGGKLGIMMGNYADSEVAKFWEEEEEAEATEADETTEATEETVQETAAPVIAFVTEPETEPVEIPTETAEPETEPVETTVPETQAPTEAPTEAPVQTEETTLVLEFAQEEAEETETVAEQVQSNSWIGIVLIAGVLTFLILGALIFRIASRRNGRYRR